MNKTIQLLRFIGSPGFPSSIPNIDTSDSVKLFDYSLKNRFSLLYLNETKRRTIFCNFRQTYQQHMAKYAEMLDAVERISRVLSKAHLRHAVFKTIRPYISTTVDIDVIVFGDLFQYERACDIAQNAGYKRIVRGPRSTTLQDPRTGIGVDLYDEVAVSYVPYIDKVKLLGDVTDTNASSYSHVRMLTPEADLVSLIAHSIVKENMYTLSEFYTYVYYLDGLDVDRFLQLAKKMHLRSAIRTHTAITALLYETAYKTLPVALRAILDHVGNDEFEAARTINNEFEMPHKYHPITVARSLLEIAQEWKTIKGIANQFLHVFDGRFFKDFLKKMNEHVKRATY